MFSIIRGGCFSRHSSDFIMNRPNGLPYYVLLIIKSYSELEIEGQRMTCRPDSALLIRPDTPYSYQNPNGEYIDDWLHFTCLPEDIAEHAALFHKCFPVSSTRVLTTYIQQALWENHYSESKEYYVDSLFRILLKHLTEDYYKTDMEEYNPYKYKLQRLRLEIQSAPYRNYTARETAARLGVSASYFQSLYRNLFHVPFKADVINMRIDYARELVSTTEMPFEQIAYQCGYSSEVHFYRQFLAKTSMTPGEYRNTFL